MARRCVRGDLVVLEADAGHAAPTVHDVAGRAPEVSADAFAPRPHVAHAVLAEAVNDVAVDVIQRAAHEVVGLLEVLALARAPVVLQVIDAPVGPRARVLFLVTEAAL